jgi:hypothetical protein
MTLEKTKNDLVGIYVKARSNNTMSPEELETIFQTLTYLAKLEGMQGLLKSLITEESDEKIS